MREQEEKTDSLQERIFAERHGLNYSNRKILLKINSFGHCK